MAWLGPLGPTWAHGTIWAWAQTKDGIGLTHIPSQSQVQIGYGNRIRMVMASNPAGGYNSKWIWIWIYQVWDDPPYPVGKMGGGRVSRLIHKHP